MSGEEQALRLVGRELYEAFFKGYTIKQWGCAPTELPAEVLRRLPVRFDYNDSYFDSRYQAMPRDGYTSVIARLLDHPGIEVALRTCWSPALRPGAEHVFFTGSLDQFFDFSEGRLGYRTVRWVHERGEGDHQGVAILNYTGLDVPWTRVVEHKHLAPWEAHPRTLVSREYSQETAPGDMPFYPTRRAPDRRVLARYVERAGRERRVSFLGRLGTYRYLDMDQVIAEALRFARACLAARAAGAPLPVFSVPPL